MFDIKALLAADVLNLVCVVCATLLAGLGLLALLHGIPLASVAAIVGAPITACFTLAQRMTATTFRTPKDDAAGKSS